MPQRHPDMLDPQHMIDHIKDALEAHLDMKVDKDANGQLSISIRVPGNGEQIIVLEIDVEEHLV